MSPMKVGDTVYFQVYLDAQRPSYWLCGVIEARRGAQPWARLPDHWTIKVGENKWHVEPQCLFNAEEYAAKLLTS